MYTHTHMQIQLSRNMAPLMREILLTKLKIVVIINSKMKKHNFVNIHNICLSVNSYQDNSVHAKADTG